jgi:hypothetical protein
MSVLSEVYAVPSRLLGVYRYLVRARGQSEAGETLERLLAPESLPRRAERDDDTDDEGGSGRDMVRKTIAEGKAMRLFDGAEGEVCLHANLPDEARDPGTGEPSLPVTLTNLLFIKEHPENHDFGIGLAWYLTQDPYQAPGTWAEVDRALRDQVGGDQLGMKNSNPYRMLEDWACYLGFAWTHAQKGKPVLTPDPTAHLRRRLREVLPGKAGTRHPVGDVTLRLGQLCPVFEGGFLRSEVERQWRPREDNHLSGSTALAWLRLRDEGLVELRQESDAATIILPDGDRTVPVSHLVLVPAA